MNSDIEAVIVNLPGDMLELMNQLFEESKIGEIKLDKEEFINSMNYLLKVIFFLIKIEFDNS